MPYARPAVPQDAHFLAPRMRPEDIAEVAALSGHTPLQSLLASLEEGAECLSIIDNHEEVVGMFGINHWPDFGEDQAAVWLLASPGLVAIQREFMRQTRSMLRMFHRQYPLLWNVVDERNTTHIRWLRYFGFSFLQRHERLGVEGRPFLEFVRIDPHV
jgi:hypothetical protein